MRISIKCKHRKSSFLLKMAIRKARTWIVLLLTFSIMLWADRPRYIDESGQFQRQGPASGRAPQARTLDAAPKKYACSRAGGVFLPPAPEPPAIGAGVGGAHGFPAVQHAPPAATTSPPTAPPIVTPPAEGTTPRVPTPTMVATPSPGRGCAQSGWAGDVAAHGRSAAQAVHPLPLARPRSGGATEMQVGHEAACAAGRVT